MEYLRIKDIFYSPDMILRVDCSQIENLIVKVYLITHDEIFVEGLDAIDLVMQASPTIIEGKRFKFRKGFWILHNFIGHPLMQIFALLGLFKLAMWIHNVTIPKPIGKYNENKNG